MTETAETGANGAESLIRTLVAAGVDTCFANPGTSEMHFVVALDRVPEMRPVLGLFEGAVTGMADGYGRMAGKPAVTLLHLGSGLGNGIANLHNAKRANTPMVNIVGDHASYHLQWDTPLVSDIVGLARPVSAWVHRTESSRTVGADAARAVFAAQQAPGGIATLILPADTAWGPGAGAAPALPKPQPAAVSDAAVDEAVRLLRSGSRTVILTRGATLLERGLTALGRIAAASGAWLMCHQLSPRMQRGAGRTVVERVPYRAEDIVGIFKEVANLILVGTHPPVAPFAYPDYPSWCLPEGIAIHYLAQDHEDGVSALEAVAEALGAPRAPALLAASELPGRPAGELDQFSIGAIIARHMPEGTIVSDEAATNGLGPMQATRGAPPHEWLSNTGGAIGQGIPVATGAAVASPGRKVINLQADGSAMYTLQALWTQAREKLDCVTIIFSNRSYAILTVELGRVGARNPGPRALSMFDLGNPDIDWVGMARSLGVEASQAATVAEFEAQFIDAMARPGPRLIEAVI
ncbi:acetolactate synthase large subunit [Sandaracinobacter sp. RS1-74]|uniref:acetolactate synthase large subunit n=1 Tax=Sandaracinobacteroides sayramensis TaxID=2913411 RepID=UPI001EDB3436|nr:acetolactate synthase large subunit [Sandaracinobacteroides sayramensis]MCG2840542.1 acetolactate synthase large subunit [Sandaracinobacteroides sayramensis]